MNYLSALSQRAQEQVVSYLLPATPQPVFLGIHARLRPPKSLESYLVVQTLLGVPLLSLLDPGLGKSLIQRNLTRADLQLIHVNRGESQFKYNFRLVLALGLKKQYKEWRQSLTATQVVALDRFISHSYQRFPMEMIIYLLVQEHLPLTEQVGLNLTCLPLLQLCIKDNQTLSIPGLIQSMYLPVSTGIPEFYHTHFPLLSLDQFHQIVHHISLRSVVTDLSSLYDKLVLDEEDEDLLDETLTALVKIVPGHGSTHFTILTDLVLRTRSWLEEKVWFNLFYQAIEYLIDNQIQDPCIYAGFYRLLLTTPIQPRRTMKQYERLSMFPNRIDLYATLHPLIKAQI